MSVEIHEAADGISELDNPLPRWWLYLFHATIVFAFVYSIYYPAFWFYKGQAQWTSDKAYVASLPANVTVPGEAPNLTLLGQEPGRISSGAATFQKNCAVCHGPEAKGKIGPNLTLHTKKYGNSDANILLTIRKGRPGGMPAWGKVLKPDELLSVATFIRSLEGK